MDVLFKLPANVYIYGQSQSRKSCLVLSMLRHLNELFDPPPTSRLIYCFFVNVKPCLTTWLKQYQAFSFVEVFPENLHDMLVDDKNSLIIVDDLISECSKDQRMSELFKPGSH